MNIKQRINLLVKLGEYFVMNSESLQTVKQKAKAQNPWFSSEFIDLALKNIREKFLQKDLLEAWIGQYDLEDEPSPQKNIGIVMAGNIPLVGFHDFLCVFASGHKAVIKPSSKDEVLIKHIAEKIFEWGDDAKNHIAFAEK